MGASGGNKERVSRDLVFNEQPRINMLNQLEESHNRLCKCDTHTALVIEQRAYESTNSLLEIAARKGLTLAN